MKLEVLYVSLIAFALFGIFIFVRFTPKGGSNKAVRWFNTVSVMIAILLSCVYSVTIYIDMKKGSDFGWWPVLSIMAGAVNIGVILLVASAIRWFIFIKTKKLPNQALKRD